MNPDPSGNEESGWDWGVDLDLLDNTTFIDGAIAMPNQYLPQQSQVNNMAGTSNNMGVNTSNPGIQNQPATEDPRERKRRSDKAYRDRCREDKEKQEKELDMLEAENARLKEENESLTEEKDSTSRKLDLAANEINQLRIESRNLKLTNDQQKILVDAYTEKIANQDKAKSLEEEVARLRSENVGYAKAIEEKKQLLEELLKLKNENKLLELQNQAYCMMIQNGSRNPADQDQADH